MATIILRPTAAGDEENIALPGGGTNYQQVDEVTADEGTTTVNTIAAGYERDLYDLPLIGGSGTISGVEVYARICAYSTPTQANAKICLKTGGTAYEGDAFTSTGGGALGVPNNFTTYSKEWTTNPDTAVAWTWANIDALQIGVSLRSATPGGVRTYCTQVYVVITYTIPAAPTMVCRIAFATAPFAATPTWTDVSSDLVAFHIRRGRQHELDRMETGTAVITLQNSSGDYWSLNTGGSYYDNVKVGKKINLRVTYSGTTYDIYTGFIQDWTPIWGGPNLQPQIVLKCADLVNNLSRRRINDDSGYAQENSGTRIDNVLTSAGWPAGLRDTDTGDETLVTTGAISNMVAQTHIYDVCNSEMSLFYIAGDGDTQYEKRSHRNESPHTAAVAIFGDSGDDWENRYADIDLAYDDTLLFTEARMTITGGTEQIVTGNTATYETRSEVRTGLLLTSDAAAKALAVRIIARYSDTKMRARKLLIYPQRDTALLYPKVLSYDISTRITVRLDVASIDNDYFIEGIQHDYDARNLLWKTSWQLSDAAQYLYTPEATEDTLRPSGAGTTTGLSTVSGAATHWEAVDEATTDEDTSYVEAVSVENAYDTYATENAPYASGTINSVTLYIRARETGGSGAAWTRIRTNSQEYSGSVNSLTTSYQSFSKAYSTNPQTGIAWTWTEINAMEIGIGLESVAGGTARCTQVYAVVNYTPSW